MPTTPRSTPSPARIQGPCAEQAEATREARIAWAVGFGAAAASALRLQVAQKRQALTQR